MAKLMIPLYYDDVAPRFDLATEVRMIFIEDEDGTPVIKDDKVVVLSNPSGETLCRLVLADAVTAVICAGIDEEYFQFLEWKKVSVMDGVSGPSDQVLARYLEGSLTPGTILSTKPEAAE